MRRLPMRKIHDALRLSAEGLSTRQIEASLVIGRTTLRGYLERARAAGLSWPLPADLSEADVEKLLFPRTAQEAARKAVEPDWAHMHRELRRKCRCALINQIIRIERGSGQNLGVSKICYPEFF